MTVRKWSFEEERILAEVYFRLELDWPVTYIVREVAEELGRHGYERPDSAIRAKIYDVKRVDEGLDLSHVSKTTIQAYLDCPGQPVRNWPLLEELRSSNLSGQPFDFDTQFLSANNPFANVRYDTDPMEDRPTWDFQTYFNDVIENLDFFRHIKWSTIYTFAEVSHTTANEMRAGKTKIDKLNLFRLMIAMRLDDPKVIYSLMKKAGLAFSSFSPDKVVAVALRMRIRDKTQINEALIDDGCEPLFKKHAKLMHQIPQI